MNLLSTHDCRLPIFTRSLLLGLAGLLLFWPAGGEARSISELQGRIAANQAKQSRLGQEVSNMSGRITGLRSRIYTLQRRQNAIQTDLDRKADRQQRIAGELDTSRSRLKRLRSKLAHARTTLAARIVEVYKQGEPSIVDVVLNADGFSDMVERATYLDRIAKQDRAVIATVTKLRTATHKETVRLADLEREASRLVAEVRSRRDEIAGAKHTLADRRSQLDSAVKNRKSKMAVISRNITRDMEDLAAQQASNGSIVGVLNDGTPVKQGNGSLVWPVNGQFTSPFGARWGRLHAGIDIAVPNGTAVHAADTGTVRIAGWVGGYGNYICIQHGSSMSTCYGHNSRLLVSVGQTVAQGQVIAASGNTGHSTGPHVHFEVRINGNPVNPMAYL